MTIPDRLLAARQAALEPEQPLLLMLSQRRASRRVVAHAVDCYSRARDHAQAALDLIDEARKVTR